VSNAPFIIVGGHELQPLERIHRFGAAIGLSREQAYAASVTWPLVGPSGNVFVVTQQALEQAGIAFTYRPPRGRHQS